MEWVRLGDLVDIKTGKLNANAAVPNGRYPFFTTAQEISFINSYSYDDEVVLVAGNGDLNVKYYNGKFDAYQRTYILTKKENVELNLKFLYFFMSDYVKILRSQSIGGVIKYIKLENLTEAKIPLLSFVQQTIIVNKLNKAEALKEFRKEQIQAYDDLIESLFLEMFGDVRINEKKFLLKKWKDVLNIVNGKNQKKVENPKGKFPIYGSGGIMSYADDWLTKENSIIIGRKGNINNPIYVREKFWNVDTAFGLEPDTNLINADYLFGFCRIFNFEILNKAVTIPSLTKRDLLEIDIPVPPIELQNKFADYVIKIEEEKKKLRSSLAELETLFDALMQDAFSGNLFKD